MKGLKNSLGLVLIVLLALSCSESDVSPVDQVEETDCEESITDVDGNEYKVVRIGSQCWTAENLRVLNYPDGTPIEQGTPDLKLNPDDNPKYYFEYDTFLRHEGDLYTLLTETTKVYTWAAATNFENTIGPDDVVQGICPDGWHVPSKNEWDELIEFLGQETAGQQLKSTDTLHWRQASQGFFGSDTYGFKSISSGGRDSFGAWYILDQYAFYWSSTPYESETWRIHTPYIVPWHNAVQWLGYSRSNAFCVRCVKDR